eukprot:GFYU01001845.1.p1 GENE.GFYU01001845.1~~GFYU01001845.1.p1  ORF type:complete len:354 (-),score=116.53 GFYU01001845.1:51-1112(-)
MKSSFVTVTVTVAVLAIACVASVSGHKWMGDPLDRTNECLLNGVIIGDLVNGQQDGNNGRAFHFNYNQLYAHRACGGANDASINQGLIAYCGNMDTKPDLFDMDVAKPVAKTYTAGEEFTAVFHGFFHPGVLRLAVCYENCNDMASFEDNILGYWFMEGTSGPQSDIYSAQVSVKAKMPNRNSERAVLQWLVDADDVRSYVSCADIAITGGTDSGDIEVECNGHPFCDCNTVTTGGDFGLGKDCPYSSSDSTFKAIYDFKDQLGEETFCGLCVDDGCPSTCGGKWFGSYNGPNKKGGVHKNNLPQYHTCSTSKPCKCPSCNNGAGGSTPIGNDFGISAAVLQWIQDTTGIIIH